MKFIKFLALSISIWFFFVSNFTIFDSDIMDMGEALCAILPNALGVYIAYKFTKFSLKHSPYLKKLREGNR